MNLQDLITKLQAIEEGTTSAPPVAPTKDDMPAGAGAGDEDTQGGAGASDEGIEECGGDMPGDMMNPPKQADNVTMNVSMNGSGSGGIADLMKILRNIEQAGEVDKKPDSLFGDGYENSVEGGSDVEVYGTDAVTPTGDDLASKGDEAEKVNGGGNPMGVDESLVSHLTNLYNEVKSR